ncbi:DUF2690 domain-containing protein [Streptomyces termitum]
MDGAGSDRDLGLAGELLALKKASGSSFAQLSEKTHYAKSSWERWVNGKQFPPRDAVESLARLCGTDPGPLLALWAEEEARRTRQTDRTDTEPADGTDGTDEAGKTDGAGGSDKAAGASEADGTDEAGGTAASPLPKPSRRGLWAALVLAVLLVAGAGTYAVASFTGSDGGPPPAARPLPSVKAVGPATGCTLAACEGRDPKKMNCGADAVTVRTGSIPKDLVIELRYSRACKAAWGRISFAEVGATVVVNNSDGAAQADVVHYDRDVYTPLVAAPDDGSVFACAALPRKNGQDNAPTCTGRFIPSREAAQQP